jgi:hypothetical protein
VAWYEAEIRSLEEPDLFPQGEDVRLSDNQYRAVMPRKIDAVIHQAIHTLRGRIKGHLDEIEQELAWIDDAHGHVDRVDAEIFDDLIAALG